MSDPLPTEICEDFGRCPHKCGACGSQTGPGHGRLTSAISLDLCTLQQIPLNCRNECSSGCWVQREIGKTTLLNTHAAKENAGPFIAVHDIKGVLLLADEVSVSWHTVRLFNITATPHRQFPDLRLTYLLHAVMTMIFCECTERELARCWHCRSLLPSFLCAKVI